MQDFWKSFADPEMQCNRSLRSQWISVSWSRVASF